jgi:hypothetical protein
MLTAITLDEVLKFFAAIGGLLVVFVSLFTATQAASKSGFEQLERAFKKMEERYLAMEKRLEHLEQENHDLRVWAEELVNQIEEAGLVPAQFRKRTGR